MQISIPPHSLFLLPSPHPAIFSSSLLPKHHVYFLEEACDCCCRSPSTDGSIGAGREWGNMAIAWSGHLACVPALGPPAPRRCVTRGTSAVVSLHFKLLWPPSTLVLLHRPIPASCRPLPSPFHSELRASRHILQPFLEGATNLFLSLFFFFS